MVVSAAAPAEDSNDPARAEWRVDDPLRPLEREMIDKAATGEPVEIFDQLAPDLRAMQAWGPERTIRAAVLRHLLVEPEPDWPVHAKGVRLRGVRISGQLDLEAATLRCPLRLSTCFLDDPQPLQLNYATISLLEITDSHLAGLQGDRLVVTKLLAFTGSILTQPVRLVGAEITGLLSWRGAQLQGSNADGDALVADGLKVGGDVLLDRGFSAAGAVALTAAQIGASCRLVDAQLAEDIAFRAEGLKIGHELRWAPRAPVSGEVNLERAETHRLVDNWALPDAHWPPEGRLRLTGFTYDGFGGNPRHPGSSG